MKTYDVLVGVRELIKDPDHWTQFTFARDSEGNDWIEPWEPEACQWCVNGAIQRTVFGEIPAYESAVILDYDTNNAVQVFLDAVALERFSMGSVNVNDKLGHESVMAILDQAIEQLEESDASDNQAAA